MSVDYHLQINYTHDPKGPDGKGWNRVAIINMTPTERCALLPQTRQAALDTLRGMSKFGNPTAYDNCISKTPCETCPLLNKEREAWKDEWHVREDPTRAGRVWLLANVEKGFGGFGYSYKNWASLMKDIEVPMLKRMIDQSGTYWVAAPSIR